MIIIKLFVRVFSTTYSKILFYKDDSPVQDNQTCSFDSFQNIFEQIINYINHIIIYKIYFYITHVNSINNIL